MDNIPDVQIMGSSHTTATAVRYAFGYYLFYFMLTYRLLTKPFYLLFLVTFSDQLFPVGQLLPLMLL